MPTRRAGFRSAHTSRARRPQGANLMDRIRIIGGRRLNGTIPISGAKNASLPLMIASLLTDQTLILDNVPRLADVVQLQPIPANHPPPLMTSPHPPAQHQP